MQLTRRTVLSGLAASTALASPTVLRAQTRELVMVGYGNDSDAPLIAAGEELGRRNPGVSLRVIGGLSAEALAQIKAARGNSPNDLAVMGPQSSTRWPRTCWCRSTSRRSRTRPMLIRNSRPKATTWASRSGSKASVSPTTRPA